MKPPLAVAAGICLRFATLSAVAGGGPENVFLLVNANSESSKAIANSYISWREIPASNVLYVDWKGYLEQTDPGSFRAGILTPARTAIDSRGLASQIDYLVYSSDFPWRIDLHLMFPDRPFPPEQNPYASITGATYLAPLFLSENPALTHLDVNWYVPGTIEPNIRECEKVADVPSRGFRRRYFWDKDGRKTNGQTPGQQYLLSTMLGVTSGRGNTVDEVLNYLRRSVAADGTRPRGTIYFMWNKDVRSTPRDKCFSAVAAQINALGGHAVVQQGIVPTGAKDVTGMMVGASDFNLASEAIRILPGAICDHLTSNGGDLITNYQTPLTEFLRHGAAGASGTVIEPYSIQAKFPLPSIHLHYVRGCSLAESFYQSVSCPFQLLIVGDPLCQPWATFPAINVQGVKPGDKVKGTLSITPNGPKSIGNYEVFIDGRLAAYVSPLKPFALDTTHLADGYHEIRVVGVRSDPIETRGRRVVPIFVNNHDSVIEFKLSSPSRVSRATKLKLNVRQPGATSIAIRQNSREVARIQAESGEVEIAAASLGRGPTTLQAFSEGKAAAASVPIRVLVE